MTTRLSVFLLLLICAVSTAHAEGPLARYQWSHRLVLVYDPAGMQELEAALAEFKAELIDRDILVLPLHGDLDHDRVVNLSQTDRDALRRRYQIDSGQTAYLLIGKDGGLKERAPKPAWKAFFAAVDQMPMRRQELRNRSL